MKKNILILSLSALISMQLVAGKHDKVKPATNTNATEKDFIVKLNDAEKEILEKNEKTGYATKLSDKMNVQLWLMIYRNEDKKTTDFIKKLNLDPDYKLYSNNIIVNIVSNKLVDALQEILKRGANYEIKSNDGKTIADIAKETKDDRIKVLIEARILNKK